MSLPRYSKYKDSGITWIGSIPAGWSVLPLLSVASERAESNSGMREDNLLSLSYGRIVRKDIQANDGLLPESFETYQIVKPGDIVLRLTDLQNDKRSLRSALVEKQGIITSAYLAIQPTKVESRFLAYLLRAYDLTKVFYSMGGGLRQSMKFTDMKRMPMVIPSDEEQITIVAFLDRETGKIDALIAEQETLLTLLAEKRQATISHVVTRGLNPDAPTKDSGVAWLGEVPAHWDVVPIKRVVEVKDGTHATPAYVDPTSESYPLITSKDFVDSDICFDDAKYISSDDHSEIIRRSNTEQGDVLMSMIGGNIGKAVVVKSERKFSIKNLALFKTSHSGSLGKFVLYYLQSGLLDIQIDLIGRGGAQGFLGLGDIRNLVFFKIAEHELQQVVSHLETKLAPLDKLVKLAEKHLLTLKERRAALIAAVVTGQIDVRNAVPEELTA